MAYDTITQQFTGQPAAEVTCWCGVQFAIPRSLYTHYRSENDAKAGSYALHCPLGHPFIPSGRSEAERLRDELAREKHRTEQAEADARNLRTRVTMKDRQIAAKKGQLTRIKNRVGNGVCPCCNRFFANLHRHMSGQHPDWSPDMVGDNAPDLRKVRTGDSENWKALAQARRSLGMSVQQAARGIGLKASSLRAYEAGTMGSKAAARRMADYLATKEPS